MAAKRITSKKRFKRAIKGFVLVVLFKFFALLPLFINRSLAFVMGKISYLISGNTKKITSKNLALCFPDLNEVEQRNLMKKNYQENAKLAFEFPMAWLGRESAIKSALTQVSQKQIIDQYLANNKSVVIAVPHIGNWELMWHWLQINFEAIGMYSPAKLLQVDKMMFRSRQRFGGQVFATDAKGIMSLIRRLKKGSVMMILTDQVPRDGAGNFVPFFDQPAYTMTLLHRILQKTNAELVFGSCLRESGLNDFSINIEQASFDTSTVSAEEFNTEMNRQVENIIRTRPEQYQWSYKRFKRQPNGINPYQ